MLRRLLTLASAVSLVLCVAATVLWVRSRTWYDEGFVAAAGYRVKLESADGRFAVVWHRADPAMPASGSDSGSGTGPYRGNEWDPYRGWYAGRPTGLWTAVQFVGRLPSERIRAVVVGYGFVVAATLLLPIAWYRQYRRAPEMRRRAGLCPACGYDLRATPGRCPECGRGPAVPTTAREPPTGGDR